MEKKQLPQGTAVKPMAQGQPMMAPVMQQPAVMPGSVVVPGAPIAPVRSGPPGVPPGAPPGGRHIHENFCGQQTICATVITAIVFWPATCCIPCCKCDQRKGRSSRTLGSTRLHPARLHARPSAARSPPLLMPDPRARRRNIRGSGRHQVVRRWHSSPARLLRRLRELSTVCMRHM